MANKQINELNSKTTVSGSDLILVYDVSESGSEKTKNITVEDFMGVQWIEVASRSNSSSMTHVGTSLDTNKRYKYYTQFTPNTPANTFQGSAVYNGDYTSGNYVANPDIGANFIYMPDQSGIDKVIIENIFDIPKKIIYGSSYVIKTSSGVQRNDFVIRYLSGSSITTITNHLYDGTLGGSSYGSVNSKLYIER